MNHNLGKRARCPIHNSYFCCGRNTPSQTSAKDETKKPYRFKRKRSARVERIDDPAHPRGYREICSRLELTFRKNELIEKGEGCWICGQPFTDYRDVELEHKEPCGMGGGTRDDHRDNLALAHRSCNQEKGSRRMQQSLEELRDDFYSQKCPACGGLKREKNSFCADCYFKLPPQLRRDLYKLIGFGYAEAVANAKQFLAAARQAPVPEELAPSGEGPTSSAENQRNS